MGIKQEDPIEQIFKSETIDCINFINALRFSGLVPNDVNNTDATSCSSGQVLENSTNPANTPCSVDKIFRIVQTLQIHLVQWTRFSESVRGVGGSRKEEHMPLPMADVSATSHS
ncbi:hypothetical protein CEXT_302781 [Caerostris extrusa]|uniref:Uncharacterized protein n=1 Tax=Caerostris extrusa TaxID=172846 RepID=A0AAV4NP86_CAEEX|nr:hypothetical protein CEXT_302781 [Caerostris extrusa]